MVRIPHAATGAMVADPAAARNRFCVPGVLDTAGIPMAVILISLIGVVIYGLILLPERLVVGTEAGSN
jgi:hypothetical protein